MLWQVQGWLHLPYFNIYWLSKNPHRTRVAVVFGISVFILILLNSSLSTGRVIVLLWFQIGLGALRENLRIDYANIRRKW